MIYDFQIAFLITVSTYTTPDYGDGYVYQPYSIAIGVLMSLVPFVPIIVIMVKEIMNAEGSLLQVSSTLNNCQSNI